MQGAEVLQSQGNDFDRFLYAFVGEDRNGMEVTVVSALARLGLDPWKEAAELAVLGHDAARARLEKLLSAFNDVPSLDCEHVAVSARLISLLPERDSRCVANMAGPKIFNRPPISVGGVLAVLVVVFALAQVFFLAQSG